MEKQKPQEAGPLLSLLILIASSIFLAQAQIPTGIIERTVKQQILSSFPPEHDGTSPATPISAGPSQLFLTSPSGKYAAFFLRRSTMLGAGGFGNDFCYIQIQETGRSVWESDCAPVSSENTCSLVFDDRGLEIFDGSNSMWNTEAKADTFLQTLELVDSGDMRLIDKDGNLAWKASDTPLVNQNCGSIGSPGLAPETPPFAKPIGYNDPFGQPAPIQQQLPPEVPVGLGPEGVGGAPLPEAPVGEVGDGEQPQESGNQPASATFNQPFSSVNQPQPFGGGSYNYQQQPLLDNNPFDSACPRKSPFKFGVACWETICGIRFPPVCKRMERKTKQRG